jgi:hypothetical protein
MSPKLGILTPFHYPADELLSAAAADRHRLHEHHLSAIREETIEEEAEGYEKQGSFKGASAAAPHLAAGWIDGGAHRGSMHSMSPTNSMRSSSQASILPAAERGEFDHRCP